jgi:L-histidine N-alpha-methyltransferase
VSENRVVVDVRATESEARAVMGREVREGLTRTPKEIPSKYFYDAQGSALFEEITCLPEYYLTRAERGLLERGASEIAEAARPSDLVELGPGSALKTRLLLEACHRIDTLQRYVPLEVAADTARDSARRLAADYPWLAVHAIVGDFERHLDALPPGGPRLVAFLGSTIGNFLRPQAEALLTRVAGILGDGGRFLLGTDLVKDVGGLEAAYNDTRGVTAEFNRNILRVLNRSLDGNFEPEAFDHLAFYDVPHERIEMHLVSRKASQVTLREIGLEIPIAEGERIRTEVSCKYTRRSVEDLLASAGLVLERWYDDGDFALSLSRRNS